MFTRGLLSVGLLSGLLWGGAPDPYPPGELGRMVKLGETLMTQTGTHPVSAKYVTNKLSCESCHPAGDDGRTGTRTTPTSSLLGAAAAYPALSTKQGVIITLQDRISDCFMDCMSGPRSPIDSEANIAMTTYVTWLSHKTPVKMNPRQPVSMLTDVTWYEGKKKFTAIQKKATHKNYISGKKKYLNTCAACHGDHGQGTQAATPLWGKDKQGNWLSYDANSGLGALHKAGIWIQQNMPSGNEGTLLDQEAADVALYLCAQPREPFDTQKALRITKGPYRSKHPNRIETVRNQFKKLGLNVDTIRGDHVIP